MVKILSLGRVSVYGIPITKSIGYSDNFSQVYLYPQRYSYVRYVHVCDTNVTWLDFYNSYILPYTRFGLTRPHE